VLATVLFTDIVGSTKRAEAIGDRAWHDLLDRHNEIVRREVLRHRGREVKTTGGGFLITFDGPARSIRCSLAISEALEDLGLQVRTGLHTGEVEMTDNDLSGIAVHIARALLQWHSLGRFSCRARSATLSQDQRFVFAMKVATA
jgi:class 3 adenylate cyclase